MAAASSRCEPQGFIIRAFVPQMPEQSQRWYSGWKATLRRSSGENEVRIARGYLAAIRRPADIFPIDKMPISSDIGWILIGTSTQDA